MNRDLLASLGPSYQAALGAISLADSADDDEEMLSEKYADMMAEQQGNEVVPSTLGDIQLSYASPFEETAPVQLAAGGEVGVQKLAFGGLPYKPSALIPSRVKNQVATAQSALEAYNNDVNSYNDRLNDYTRQVEEYNNQINSYNDQANQYKSSFIGGDNPVVFIKGKGGTYQAAIGKAGSLAQNTPNISVSEYGRIPQLGNVQGYYIRQGDYRDVSQPGDFSATAPTAPNSPTAPTQTVEQAQASVAAAKDKQRRLQLTYDVMEDPERFNLSMPALFAEGGVATQTAVPDSAAADYEKFMRSMKGVKNQQDMTPAQNMQMIDTREKIFDPFTQEALRQYKLYHGPMIPKPITSKSPTTLFAGAPGAKVLELADLEDSNMSGFVIHPSSVKGKRTEDIIFVAPPMSQRANKIMQNRAPERFVENENPEKAEHLLLAHEAEHLLKRRADRDINETFDQLTKQARGENFLGSLFKTSPYLLRSRFVKDAANATGYLKDKFKLTLPLYFDPKHVDSSMFHEQVATLAGLEETFGVDLTQDPVLRKTLFNDPDVRRAYKAVTGLRQTRLDAKDLAPYTLTPDSPYYPDASKIRTPAPRKRAGGSPIYGEIPDSGPITADTRAAMSNFQVPNAREAMDALKKIYGEGISNAESIGRGSLAAIPGTFGDIGQEFDIRGLRELPTTEQLLAKFPQRMTQPTKEADTFINIGQYVPPVSPSFVKNTAQTMMKAFKKAAPQAGNVTNAAQAAAPVVNAAQVVAPVVKTVDAAAPATRTADQLFVGRIDEFLANQKNPVTKEQLIGQLKGKFRDYEIARVEEALADLPAASKLQPADLLARVKSKYPVENFRTSIIEPKPGVPYNDMDNVYKKDVGVINLTLPVTEQAQKVSDEAMLTLHHLSNFGQGKIFSNQLGKVVDYLNEKGLSSNYKELLKSMKAVENNPEIKQLQAAKNTLIDVGTLMRYPNLHPMQKEIAERIAKQNPGKYYGEIAPLINAELAKMSLKQLTDLSLNDKFKSLQPLASRLKRIIDSGEDVKKSDILGRINTEIALIDNKFKPIVDSVVSGAAKDEYTRLGKDLQNKAVYQGQHASITTKENPIAFSRFVDKVATIPGRGDTRVMHVIELQSDLFDDIIKKGSKAGSKEKDLAEAVTLDKKAFQIEQSGPFQREAIDKIKQARNKQYASPAEQSDAIKQVLDRYPELKPQLIDYIKLTDRSSKLNARATVGNYGMDEAFAGMEKSPQVLQQLMIKNSIGAAMQRGVNAITFPGKESAQAQLYEKLGPNLKQVVKDLGKGFEIRPIEMYDDFGNAYMHQGIVWDKDTAARVLKEGIKFNKGGAVDKNNLDYAKYI